MDRVVIRVTHHHLVMVTQEVAHHQVRTHLQVTATNHLDFELLSQKQSCTKSFNLPHHHQQQFQDIASQCILPVLQVITTIHILLIRHMDMIRTDTMSNNTHDHRHQPDMVITRDRLCIHTDRLTVHYLPLPILITTTRIMDKLGLLRMELS